MTNNNNNDDNVFPFEIDCTLSDEEIAAIAADTPSLLGDDDLPNPNQGPRYAIRAYEDSMPNEVIGLIFEMNDLITLDTFTFGDNARSNGLNGDFRYLEILLRRPIHSCEIHLEEFTWEQVIDIAERFDLYRRQQMANPGEEAPTNVIPSITTLGTEIHYMREWQNDLLNTIYPDEDMAWSTLQSCLTAITLAVILDAINEIEVKLKDFSYSEKMFYAIHNLNPLISSAIEGAASLYSGEEARRELQWLKAGKATTAKSGGKARAQRYAPIKEFVFAEYDAKHTNKTNSHAATVIAQSLTPELTALTEQLGLKDPVERFARWIGDRNRSKK